jgi:hypothetical protein
MTNCSKTLLFLAIAFSSANVLSEDYYFVINIGNSNIASEEAPIDEDAVLSWVNSNCGNGIDPYSFSDYESLENEFLQRNMLIQCQVGSVLPPILPEMNYPIMKINGGGIIGEFSFLSKTVKNSGFHYFSVSDFGYDGHEIDHSALNGIKIGDPDSDPMITYGGHDIDPTFSFIFQGAGSIPDVKFTDSLGRVNLSIAVDDDADMLSAVSLSDRYDSLRLTSFNTISNVDALAGITSVENLYLNMDGLTNISGLSNFTSPESIIIRSSMLKDISGIRNISSVSQPIVIQNDGSGFTVKVPFDSPFCLNYEDINVVNAYPFTGEKYTKEEVCETE